MVKPTPESVGIKRRPMLYTIDQISNLIMVDEKNLINMYIYFQGRSTGILAPKQLVAVNIAINKDDKPDWRIEEGELVRWMRRMGFRSYV